MFGASKQTVLILVVLASSLVFGGAFAPVAAQGHRVTVGKQPGARKDMVHRNAPSGRSSGGLFGRLFGGSSDDERPSRRPANDSAREPADWSGVPYHEPEVARRNTQSQPLQDPTARARAEESRMVRRGTTTNRLARPTTTAKNGLGPIPTPPAEVPVKRRREPAPVVSREKEPQFSNTFSSRRSGRRNIDPLDNDALLSTSDLKPQTVGNRGMQLDEVPRVQQRPLPGAATTQSPKPSQQASSQAPASPAKQAAARATKKEKTPAAIEPIPRKRAMASPAPAAVATENQVKTPPSLATGSESAGAGRPGSFSDRMATTGDTAKAAPEVASKAPTASPAKPSPQLNSGAPEATATLPAAAAKPAAPAAIPAATEPQVALLDASEREKKQNADAPGTSNLGSGAAEDATRNLPPDALSPEPVGSGIAANPKEKASPAERANATPAGDNAVADNDTGSDAGAEAISPSLAGADVQAESRPAQTIGSAATGKSIAMRERSRSVRRDGTWQRPSATPRPEPAAIADSTTDAEATTPSVSPTKLPMAGNGRQPLETNGKLTRVPAELPGVRVIAAGPGQIMIRQNTSYEIEVENRGSVAASGVLIRTAIPDWIVVRGKEATQGEVQVEGETGKSQLLWQVENLPAGKTEKLTLQLEAERSGTFGMAVDWTLLPQKNKLMVNVQEPKLQLLIEGPDQVIYGESETYKVRVLNPGDGMAPNVVFTLSPNSATPQTQKVGSIPAGKEAQFEVELTAQDLGDLQIHGLATGDLQLRTEGTKTIRVAAAQLEAVLSGPPLRYQNGEATYTLKVMNTGSATSRDVVAQLRLPVGVEYLGGLTAAEMVGNVLQWKIDRLDSGDSRDYEFRCKMKKMGSHEFAFQCEGTAAGKAAVALMTEVDAIADLVLTINDPPAPAPVGQDVVYELAITNRGSKAATDITALTHFSDHIEPNAIAGHSGKVEVGQALFDPIPRIDPGQKVTLRITAQAQREGHHRFRAEVSSGETVLVAEEGTRYLSPAQEQISRRSTEDVDW